MTPLHTALIRDLVAFQVAIIEHADTDVNDGDKADEHLKEMEACLKKLGKDYRSLVKEDC